MTHGKPVQQPPPAHPHGLLSPDSFAIAGAAGHNVFMSSAFGLTVEQAKTGIAAYRQARAAAGLDPAAGQVANLFMIYPGDSMDQARRDFRDPVIWYYRTIAKYVAPPVDQPAVKSYEGYQDVTRMAQQVQFEDLLESPILVCGDVDYCTETVVTMAREFGFNEILC